VKKHQDLFQAWKNWYRNAQKGLKLLMDVMLYFTQMSFGWFKGVRERHKDLEGGPRNGWSPTAWNTEMVTEVCELVTREH
jgi:hypothetical protein